MATVGRIEIAQEQEAQGWGDYDPSEQDDLRLFSVIAILQLSCEWKRLAA